MIRNELPPKQGLYDPRFEHDACGVGFIVHMQGHRSHAIVEQALTILQNLEHRGACGAETNTGDGAGILIQIPDPFLQKVAAAAEIPLPEAGQYGVGMVYTSLMRRNGNGESKFFSELSPRKARKFWDGGMCPRMIPVWGIRKIQRTLYAPGFHSTQFRPWG